MSVAAASVDTVCEAAPFKTLRSMVTGRPQSRGKASSWNEALLGVGCAGGCALCAEEALRARLAAVW